MAKSRFLDYEQAATYLGVNVTSVEQNVSRGVLHPTKARNIGLTGRKKYLNIEQLNWFRENKGHSALMPANVLPEAITQRENPTVTATLTETWNTTPETVKRGQVGIVVEAILNHSSSELAAWREMLSEMLKQQGEMVDQYGKAAKDHIDKVVLTLAPILREVLDHDVTREEIETLIYEQRANSKQQAAI